MLFCSFTPAAAVSADPRELRAHVDMICRAADLDSIEKLAVVLDVDEALLRRQLNGEGHLSLTRIIAKLAPMCPGFWSRYAWQLACHYGMPEEAHRSADFVRAVVSRRRNLKIAAAVPQKRMIG